MQIATSNKMPSKVPKDPALRFVLLLLFLLTLDSPYSCPLQALLAQGCAALGSSDGSDSQHPSCPPHRTRPHLPPSPCRCRSRIQRPLPTTFTVPSLLTVTEFDCAIFTHYSITVHCTRNTPSLHPLPLKTLLFLPKTASHTLRSLILHSKNQQFLCRFMAGFQNGVQPT